MKAAKLFIFAALWLGSVTPVFGADQMTFSHSMADVVRQWHSDHPKQSENATIDNFHQVSGRLFRSGHIDEAAADELALLRFAKVISLDNYAWSEDKAEDELGLLGNVGVGTWEWWPMSGIEPPTVAAIFRAILTINEALNTPPFDNVLVHCRHGSDRTGMVIAAWRMIFQGWEYEQAVGEMRRLGHTPLLYWWDPVLKEFEGAAFSRLQQKFRMGEAFRK